MYYSIFSCLLNIYLYRPIVTCSALVSPNPVNLLNLSCNNILNLCEFRSLLLVVCEGMDQIQVKPKQ